MVGRLSGVDAIAPAFERTKKQLLAPFRFERWLRLALVCFLTGEITGGGGGNGFRGINVLIPSSPHDGRGNSYLAALPGWMSKVPLEIIGWVFLGVIALVMLVLVLFYISSVFRFILFDAVLNNRCELGEGWRRWQRQGSSYFLWQISFGLATFAAVGLVVGVPVFVAWREGIFSNPDQHLMVLIMGVFILFFLFVAIMIASAVGSVFAKDFVVPVMALEGHGVVEGWRRLLPMLGREKGAYAFYVLMKIVLAIGSALLFGILDFMIVFALLIPIGLAGIVAFLIAKGAGLTWNPLTIGLTMAAGCAVVLLLLAVTAFISTPAMVFFQAYSMHFFGSRYTALGGLLSPPEAPP
jgi:hypothetical protein